MFQTLELAPLRSLHSLTVVVGPAQRDGGHPDTDEFNDFVERLVEAAEQRDEELERYIVMVHGDDADDMLDG